MHQTGWGRYAVSRRGVVVTGGVITAGVVLSSGGTPIRVLGPILYRASPWDGEVRVERIRRASDLLVANLLISTRLTYTPTSGGPYLVAGNQSAYLGLVLPAQSVGENVATDPHPSIPDPPVKAELALPTVLGFSIPPFGRIKYDLDELLDLQRTAVYGDPVGGVGTQIEAPFRLRIHPHDLLEWINDTAPKSKTVRGVTSTELWHTRLAGYDLAGGGPDRRSAGLKVTRVTDAFPSGLTNPPLSLNKRQQIVANANTFGTD